MLRRVTLFACICVCSSATTIYSNFGYSNIPPSLSGYDICCGVGEAFSFIVPGHTNYQLTEIDVPLIGDGSLSSTTSTIALYTDAAGVPGTVIESVTVPIPVANQCRTCPVSIARFQTQSELVAGTAYWVAVIPPVTDQWYIDPASHDTSYLAVETDGQWRIPPDPFGNPQVKGGEGGYIVIGTPIGTPEPAPIAMCAIGLGALVLLRWVRNCRRQVNLK
jgi:hypothetical protein